MKKGLNALLLVILTLSLAITPGCKTDKDKNQIWEYLLLYFFVYSPGEHYSRLYKIQPTDITNRKYELLRVTDATAGSLVTQGKSKLVLVHGWFPGDRSGDVKYPSNETLKKRITDPGNWGRFIDTADFWSLMSTYDIYAYDYLTSDPIDKNGRRFRYVLDQYLGDEANLVSVYAHSMGGLVTRFAVYEDDRPSYMNKIITSGTPYHGSPWASPEFQEDFGGMNALTGELAEILTFFTNTSGGQGLAWDNFDGKIAGASNPLLEDLNAIHDRDDLFTAYYGSCDHTNATGACPGTDTGAKEIIEVACPIFRSVSGQNYSGSDFSPSDCVVPAISATFQTDPSQAISSANSYASTVTDLGGYDHLDIKMDIQVVRDQLLLDL